MILFENLLCPLDQQSLSRDGASFMCAQGHRFDLSKTGYLNLLPVQNKRSKEPGDSKVMVMARQAFLQQQHYWPLVSAIESRLKSHFASTSVLRLFDAGCGEGYYLTALESSLKASGIVAQATGIDISKWAVLAASKRTKTISWLVASNAHIPMASNSVDVILCLFGFPVFSEFERLLAANGLLLVVDAGPAHLIELRRILYPHVRAAKQPASVETALQFVEQTHLTFEFCLNDALSIEQLLVMTPHVHKASYEGREALKTFSSLTLTADITLRWYQKKTEV